MSVAVCRRKLADQTSDFGSYCSCASRVDEATLVESDDRVGIKFFSVLGEVAVERRVTLRGEKIDIHRDSWTCALWGWLL